MLGCIFRVLWHGIPLVPTVIFALAWRHYAYLHLGRLLHTMIAFYLSHFMLKLMETAFSVWQSQHKWWCTNTTRAARVMITTSVSHSVNHQVHFPFPRYSFPVVGRRPSLYLKQAIGVWLVAVMLTCRRRCRCDCFSCIETCGDNYYCLDIMVTIPRPPPVLLNTIVCWSL